MGRPPNADAFVSKGHQYFAETCTDGNPSATCGTQQTLSYTHGWVYLLVPRRSGVSTAAVLVFRRRDVT